MKTEKGQFVYFVTEEICIDLGEIDDDTWKVFKLNVKEIMKSKQTDEIGMAYIAAFLIYLGEIQMLSEPYDPNTDLSH